MDLTAMHKRVIALDVHQARITACAVVEHDDGQVEVTKREFGAFKRDRRALAQCSLQIRPEVVVMESTGVYWESPFAALEAVGIVAWVVNARHVKAVPGRKTDMADAQWLATLARAGLLRASREELCEALGTGQFSATHRFVAEEVMQHIEQIEARIARMDQYLLRGLEAWQPQLKLLQTIPGIDINGAAMLLVEIGADMGVFGSAERLASWVRRLLCEFAQAAARTRCALKAKFESLAIRKGHKKSVVALAHNMLRTVYAMLASGAHYQDKSVDYEALSVAKNAPRWIKMLTKHGFMPKPVPAT